MYKVRAVHRPKANACLAQTPASIPFTEALEPKGFVASPGLLGTKRNHAIRGISEGQENVRGWHFPSSVFKNPKGEASTQHQQ